MKIYQQMKLTQFTTNDKPTEWGHVIDIGFDAGKSDVDITIAADGTVVNLTLTEAVALHHAIGDAISSFHDKRRPKPTEKVVTIDGHKMLFYLQPGKTTDPSVHFGGTHEARTGGVIAERWNMNTAERSGSPDRPWNVFRASSEGRKLGRYGRLQYRTAGDAVAHRLGFSWPVGSKAFNFAKSVNEALLSFVTAAVEKSAMSGNVRF